MCNERIGVEEREQEYQHIGVVASVLTVNTEVRPKDSGNTKIACTTHPLLLS